MNVMWLMKVELMFVMKVNLIVKSLGIVNGEVTAVVDGKYGNVIREWKCLD